VKGRKRSVKSYFWFGVCLLLLAIVVGCKSASLLTIDARPVVEADSSLLGRWRAVGDTARADYILVQSYSDHYEQFRKQFAAYGDEQRIKQEFDKVCPDYDEHKNYVYFITRQVMDGQNPHIMQWPATLSRVKENRFLNLMYWNENAKACYFFIRILSVNSRHDTCAIAGVSDKALKAAGRPKGIRGKIAKNINTPGFYADTLQLYKVSGYHATFDEPETK
jgi:hypothetical protein